MDQFIWNVEFNAKTLRGHIVALSILLESTPPEERGNLYNRMWEELNYLRAYNEMTFNDLANVNTPSPNKKRSLKNLFRKN